jgi:hypothetical protein
MLPSSVRIALRGGLTSDTRHELENVRASIQAALDEAQRTPARLRYAPQLMTWVAAVDLVLSIGELSAKQTRRKSRTQSRVTPV